MRNMRSSLRSCSSKILNIFEVVAERRRGFGAQSSARAFRLFGGKI